MKKRIVSCLIAFAIVMGGFPGSAWAGEGALCHHHKAHTERLAGQEFLPALYSEQTTPLQEETVTLYLENGDIIISEDMCIQPGGVTPHNGDCIITQKDSETPTANTVNIVLEEGCTVNITIRNIYIDAANSEKAAISISDNSRTELVLEGTNRVASGACCAGVMTGGAGSELAIRGSGSLEARGGSYGAGIGGALNQEVGTIHIEGGTISAYGGIGAAGIGGGDAAAAGVPSGGTGVIIISGGAVYAEGTENPEETGEDAVYGAAGIGGGYSAGGGTIEILGGDVTAVGAAKAPCIGSADISNITISGGTVRTRRKPDDAVKDAHEIGGYQDAWFTAPASLDSGENGRAVIYVSGPDRISSWSTVRETWNGVVWEGDTGTVYGTVDLTEDGITIGAGQTLEVPGSSDPASEPVLTVTKEGFHNSGAITGTGLVMVDGEKYRIEDNRLVPLTPDPPEVEVSITGDPSKIYDGTAAILPEGGCTVTGSDAAVAIFYKARSAPDSAYTASAPVNAGEYVVKAVCGDAAAEKAFTIAQAAPAAALIPVSVQYDGAMERTVDLSAAIAPYLLPEDVPAYTVGAFPENGCLPAEAVRAGGNELFFALSSGAEMPGGEVVVDIPVTVSGFTNYTPLTLTVRVTITAQTPSEPADPPTPPYWEDPWDDGDRFSEGGTFPNVPDRTPDSPAAETTLDSGEKVTTAERPDGSKVIEVKRTDGSASTTTVSASGRTVTTVKLSESAAAQSGVIALPMPAVPSVRDAAQAPSVTINGPEGAVMTVEIPVENAAPGTVAVAVDPDGARVVLRQTVPSENGVIIVIPAGTAVRILDNSKAFADVPAEHWARDAVDFVTSRELFSGTDAAAFSPDQEMTRGMLMTVLARLDGVETAGGQTWYEKGVAWAADRGVSSGEAPGQAVTCEQAVTMLYRYAGSPPAAGSLSGFLTDAVSVSDYAVNAVNWALENGLLTEADSGLMVPKDAATRVQTAMILMRFVERANHFAGVVE